MSESGETPEFKHMYKKSCIIWMFALLHALKEFLFGRALKIHGNERALFARVFSAWEIRFPLAKKHMNGKSEKEGIIKTLAIGLL